MSKTQAKGRVAPPKPTEEEQKQQQARFILQQRGAIIQSALNSIVSAGSFWMNENEPADVVRYAVALGDEYVKQVYGYELRRPDEEPETEKDA
jgi:hypothetical protein